jgi:hypothetical protein
MATMLALLLVSSCTLLVDASDLEGGQAVTPANDAGADAVGPTATS